MNSKERVLRAVNHKEVDRVPFDLIGAQGNGFVASPTHQFTADTPEHYCCL